MLFAIGRLCFTTVVKDITMALPGGKLLMPQASQRQEESNIMGDRSPKSNQKKITQKQSKADSASQKKKQAITAKQSANKKK